MFEIFSNYQELVKNINENVGIVFNMQIQVMNNISYFQVKIDFLKSKNEGKYIILIDNTEQTILNKKLEYYARMDAVTGIITGTIGAKLLMKRFLNANYQVNQ